MAVARLSCYQAVNQVLYLVKDEPKLTTNELIELVCEEYSQYCDEREVEYLHFYKLPEHVQLSLIKSEEEGEFEFALESESNRDEVIAQWENYFQAKFDDYIWSKWHETQQAHGLTKRYHADNGEFYYA